MIVIHIHSGLGNQMLAYSEYLALKSVNPNETFYLETIVYDISKENAFINQWNGYELERIFGINTPPNIKTIFSESQWNDIMKEVRNEVLVKNRTSYAAIITDALNHAGLRLINMRTDLIKSKHNKLEKWIGREKIETLRNSRLSYYLRRIRGRFFVNKRFENQGQYLFLKTDSDILTGMRLSFKLKGFGRERIDDQIHQTFVFPPFKDEKNQKMADYLGSVNSVAIHARRGDMLSSNGDCYRFGYFKRSVKFIRKNVKDPVFVFFTNPGSVQWCKDNYKIFGLNPKEDKILFVDWNKGNDSYRDMQLISCCHHSIITNSSFGWWGSYFIPYKDKITISPWQEMDTTHHI